MARRKAPDKAQKQALEEMEECLGLIRDSWTKAIMAHRSVDMTISRDVVELPSTDEYRRCEAGELTVTIVIQQPED